jgi:hypothetical protein
LFQAQLMDPPSRAARLFAADVEDVHGIVPLAPKRLGKPRRENGVDEKSPRVLL